MQIRTITVGAREADLSLATRVAHEARRRLADAGYTVQTLRLALAQVPNTCADVATVAQGAERLALDAGFDYVSIGPVEARRLPGLAEAFASSGALFASASIAGPDGVLRYETIRAAAEAIVAVAAATPQGLGNLRFTASACVPPGSPFFPAAYHDGGEPWLAVGPEAAALAVEAVSAGSAEADAALAHLAAEHGPERPAAGTLEPSSFVALARLTKLLERHDAQITAALTSGAHAVGDELRFAGCDWSLAPYPDAARSIGAAIEALSGAPFGAWGTLAAVRGLTAAVRAARVRQLGFSGVMLPVLEDTTLALRNDEGRYTLRDLLAFSTVCGTGLDTIPLPGDATPDQIANVLLEVAALASTLRKPLTARLMPIPGRAAGAPAGLDMSDNPQMAGYFCPTRVMGL